MERLRNYKPAKIKQSTLIGPKNKGGLQYPHFDIINRGLKKAWVKRLADSQQSNSSWKRIPSKILQAFGGFFLFKCNYDTKALKIKSMHRNVLLQRHA